MQSNLQCDMSGVHDDKLCVVFDGGEPGAGDSGGPLVTKSGNNYEQIGVMSYYDAPCMLWRICQGHNCAGLDKRDCGDKT